MNASPEKPSATVTLLLAEDDPLIGDLAARLLEDDGYRVLTARDGLEAWTLVDGHTGRIDLLLTDLMMPKLDGYELGERWRKRFPTAPIVLMTAWGEAPDVEALQPCSVLAKPFDPDELSAVVARLVPIA